MVFIAEASHQRMKVCGARYLSPRLTHNVGLAPHQAGNIPGMEHATGHSRHPGMANVEARAERHFMTDHAMPCTQHAQRRFLTCINVLAACLAQPNQPTEISLEEGQEMRV